MENRRAETARIEIDTAAAKPRITSVPDVSKQQVIALLKKHGVQDTEILESPDVSVKDVVPLLRKAKVKLPEAFFQDLAAQMTCPISAKLKSAGIVEAEAAANTSRFCPTAYSKSTSSFP